MNMNDDHSREQPGPTWPPSDKPATDTAGWPTGATTPHDSAAADRPDESTVAGFPPGVTEPAPAPGEAGGDDEVANGESLTRELRRLGELVGATLRAAANTSEAESLRAELREGASALRRELDATVETTRGATRRVQREYSSTGLQRLRSDLAVALRAVNRALDRLASNVEPAPAAPPATDDEGAVES